MDYPRDWTYRLPDGRVWSVAASSFVAAVDAERVTEMPSLVALDDEMRRLGLPSPVTRPQDYVDAVASWIDAVANDRDFDGAIDAASYFDSTNSKWAAEAGVFIAWRDAAWEYTYDAVEKMRLEQRPTPTVEALIAELPSIQWPV